MIINSTHLLLKEPIEDMFTDKQRNHGVSHGLSEAGYDIRLKQDLEFTVDGVKRPFITERTATGKFVKQSYGRFTIASAIEKFQMPNDLVGVVHDKSTWARKGLSVFNTVIEPGWMGFLTLELVYHGYENLYLPAGTGIAQVLFSEISLNNAYGGKYQNQEDMPVAARFENAQGNLFDG